MAIATDDLLTLLQWLSPSYPVGAFSYSHGVEWAIESGQLHDAETLAAWVEDVLRFGAGRSDALLIAAAHAGEQSTDETARAFAGSAERLKETTLQGAAFCQITRAVWGLEIADLTYPVALGTAARLRGLPLQPVSAAYLHAFAANLASVGMRLIPLGQTAGQRLIHALTPLYAQIASQTAHGDLNQLCASAYLSDIAAMRHETQETRIFRT